MKSYLITDPAFYGDSADALDTSLRSVFTKNIPDFALFRDKQTSDYRMLARLFIDVCHHHTVPKVILHGDYAVAQELGADGVHLTSTQFDEITEAKQSGLYVIISTHTHEEASKAQMLGADAITYSPIFPSPDKGDPKGLDDLKELVDKIKIPIFALGGIVTQEHINDVKTTGAYGFASIRFFTH